MASNLIRNFLNIFVKKSGDTMTGALEVKLTGATAQDAGTFIVDTTAASQAALVAKNATNFAHTGTLAKFQMLNGTDTGAVVKIENAGTGNSLQIDSKFVVNSAGDLTFAGTQKIIGGTSTTADLTLQTTSGVGTTGADMHFLVGNNGATEAMTILNSGNVGIGTVTPAALLHLSKANGAGDVGLIIQNNATTNGETSSVLFRTTTASTDFGRISLERVDGVNSKMRFATYQAGSLVDSLTISNASGNVGIGASNPAQKLQVTNGNLRFDQVATPTAPTVAVNATAGNLNGAYYYRVSYVTALGETETGSVSAVVNPASQQVNLSAIPTSSDTSVTARKIYRTTAGGSILLMKLVTTINDNTTTTYTDNIADGSLGVSEPRVNTTGGLIFNGTTRSGIIDNATTAIGINALRVNTGYYNTAVGLNSLYSNTTGQRNSAVGAFALQNNTDSNNTAIGSETLYLNTTGYNNSAIGSGALYPNTTGYNNSAIGVSAGRYIADGTTANQTSNTSVYLGTSTKALASGDANEIVIGYNAIGLGSNTAVLGNSSITTTALRGNVGIGTTGPGELLSLGTAGTTAGVLSLAGLTSGKAIIVVPAVAGTPTLTLPTVTGTLATLAGTETLTNKRVTRRVLGLSAGSATPSINTDNYDVVHITAQSAAITSFTTGLTGTPVDGDTLRISITDDGTARALTWGASFEGSTVALPTTTVVNTRLDVGLFWNTETTKWRCVAVA